VTWLEIRTNSTGHIRSESSLQGETNERLGVLLTQFGDVAERDVVRALSNQLGIPVAESDDYLNAPSLNDRISVEFMQRVHCVPLSVNDTEVMVAMADPGDQFVLEAIELATGLSVVPRIGTRTDIAAALRWVYGVDTEFAVHDRAGNDAAAVDHEDIEALRDQVGEAPGTDADSLTPTIQQRRITSVVAV